MQIRVTVTIGGEGGMEISSEHFNEMIDPPGRTFYRSMVASLPEIWPKLHESEIEPINIDINSALDWGYWWIPSRHS